MNTYEALKQRTEARRKAMTPAQKRREFIRWQYLAKQCAKSTLFANVFGLSENIHPFTLSGHHKPVTGMDAMAIEVTPLKWCICCYALCRDTSGNPYIKGFEIYLSEPVKQSAINKALSRAHYDWMKENVNMSQMLTLAWIATTATPPTEKMAMNLFLGLGAFEHFDFVESTDDGLFRIKYKDESCK